MSLLDDLAAKLVADGIGVIGTSIFWSSGAVIPSGAGPYISLNEVGGVQPTRIQNQRAVATQRPTVQVLVRSGAVSGQSAWASARAKAWAVYQSLDGIFDTTLSGTRYLKIAAKQEPTDMGFDATGNRVQVVFNLEIEKYPS